MKNQTVCKGRLSLITSRRGVYNGVIRGRSGADIGTYHRVGYTVTPRPGRLAEVKETWLAQVFLPGQTHMTERFYDSTHEMLEDLATIFPPK